MNRKDKRVPLDSNELAVASGKGTYVLWLQLSLSTTLEIGRLGTFVLPVGWYAYVGSAMGSGGLLGRLTHHFSPVKRPHWHVDYLRQVALCKQVWYVASSVAHEHEWAALLRGIPGARIPVPRFGASDCHCESHLFHFADHVEFAAFAELSADLLKEGDTMKNGMGLSAILC